jgi:Tol biopolymer transport system component
MWAVGGFLAAAILALAYLYLSRSEPFSPPTTPAPLTSFEGFEVDPALSADGDHIAFAWDQGTGEPYQIYVQDIDEGGPKPITNGPAEARYPVWSPDGNEIAFLRRTGLDDNELIIVRATGGAERRVTTLTDVHFIGLDWSPDGTHLAVVDREAAGDAESIFLLSLANGAEERLTHPPSVTVGDRNPSFSPDGTKLAFVRWSEGPQNEIHVLELDTGESKRLTTHEGYVRDLDWLPDGSAIVFPSLWRGITGLWVISAAGGEPSRLDFGASARSVSVSATGRLAYSTEFTNTNLWRIPGPNASRPSPATRFIASTRHEFEPQYSPKGDRIAFTSERSGTAHIWICQSDGTRCWQATPQGAIAVVPRWSPDGGTIAFTEVSSGNPDIYIMDFEVGIPFRLTRTKSIDVAWSWSRDGRTVYIVSDVSGQYEVWRMPPEGGDAEQLTTDGGMCPLESADGRTLFYAKITSPMSVWSRSLEDGREKLLFEADIAQRCFTLWNDRILYFLQDQERGVWVEAYDVDTGETRTVVELGRYTRLGRYGRHTVSPDGRWIVYTREDGGGSDVMLVDHVSLPD